MAVSAWLHRLIVQVQTHQRRLFWKGPWMDRSLADAFASLSNIDSPTFHDGGRQANFNFPELLPGSVVRVNTPELPEAPHALVRNWRPAVLKRSEMKLGHSLRQPRARVAVSFREASTLTPQIENLCELSNYARRQALFLTTKRLTHLPVPSTNQSSGVQAADWSTGLRVEEARPDFIPDEHLVRQSQY
jgi:hypothetical protein